MHALGDHTLECGHVFGPTRLNICHMQSENSGYAVLVNNEEELLYVALPTNTLSLSS